MNETFGFKFFYILSTFLVFFALTNKVFADDPSDVEKNIQKASLVEIFSWLETGDSDWGSAPRDVCTYVGEELSHRATSSSEKMELILDKLGWIFIRTVDGGNKNTDANIAIANFFYFALGRIKIPQYRAALLEITKELQRIAKDERVADQLQFANRELMGTQSPYAPIPIESEDALLTGLACLTLQLRTTVSRVPALP